MAEEATQAQGFHASDKEPQVGGDPYTMKTAGDMIAEAENQLSHATQQLPEEEMEQQRAAARAMINQVFTDGNSIEMAKDLIASQYPAMIGEMDNLVDREKSRHGDVPETQVEANQRKEEAAQEIADTFIGKPMDMARETAAASGISDSLKAMLTGFSGGAAVLGLADRQEEVRHAGQMILKNDLQEITDLGGGFSPKDAQVAHGIPGKQRSQEESLTV